MTKLNCLGLFLTFFLPFYSSILLLLHHHLPNSHFLSTISFIMYLTSLPFSFKQAIERNQVQLLSLGYPTFTLEDFHDTVQ